VAGDWGYLEINGTRLWVEVAGEGPNVVLLHHGIVDSRVWDPQWTPLTACHRVVRYDSRGFGRSPLPAGRFSLAEDLLTVLDSVGAERAALVGASMGANVALEVAVLAPERVTAVAYVPPGILGSAPSAEVRAYGDAEDEAIDRGDLDEAVRLNLDFWLAGPDRPLDDIDHAIVDQVGEMQRRAFDLQVPAFEQEPHPFHEKRIDQLVERLSEVQAPALVVAGDADASDILQAVEAIEAGVEEVETVVMPGIGHFPNLERPSELNRHLEGLLARAG
jgi:3-oxoadipate enol-lactonase